MFKLVGPVLVKQDLQEAQDTIQRMQEELKSIKQERKKAELLSIESKKESDEDMRHYELAKAKLMRTRSHTTARHGDVKRMRQKVAKRSAELQYELSELQRVLAEIAAPGNAMPPPELPIDAELADMLRRGEGDAGLPPP